ncbi:serine protease [Treponema primitia]|uniref:trypsin-like peptidase domain-containing protein n=1 Tax=Treponema primitia TaxID=88058 RepID=UPI0039816A18
MFKKIIFCFCLLFFPVFLFAQTGAGVLRDYVGVIHQSYHPDVVGFMNKLKDLAKKRGRTEVVSNIEAFLKGGFGSGFVYVDSAGNNYILTNYHVITKAYTISIEFEKQDGTKISFTGLNVIAADENTDIALLAFPPGERPFKTGLPLASRLVEEGEDVYSAGFPGLGANPVWQFGRGIVSNARVVIPPTEEDNREYGPWVQHTAQVDAGNSGGPLLVMEEGQSIAYSVVGINTASGVNRQAANYAIPINTALDFISLSLKDKDSGEQRRKLEEKVREFVEGLSANKAVYPHIARYLSNECVASNAEFAISEVEDSANYGIQNTIFNQSVFTAIDYSVGWLIESEFRKINNTGAMHPSVGTITGNADGTWTVPIVFPNNREVNTIWVSEYGMWRLKSSGSVTGNSAAMDKKIKERKTEKNLRTDYTFALSAGYAYLGLGESDPRGSALDVSMEFGDVFTYGVHLFFQGSDFGIAEGKFGYTGAIRINKVALMPFGNVGFGLSWHEKDYEYSYSGLKEEKFGISDISTGLSFQGGIKVTTSYVPGLFLKTAYQFNYYRGDFFGRNVPLKDVTHSVIIGVGYLF